VLLSIITVTKDDPAGWRATLASLQPLRDTDLRWEHIAVSPEPLTAPGGWPLVFLNVPAEGIFQAMNAGLARARGEVVWFLNGGDRLKDPAALARVLACFVEQACVDLVAAAADLVAENEFRFVLYPRSTLARSLLSGRQLCHQAILFRRRVFDELGPYSSWYQLAGDDEFLLRFFLSGRESRCLADRLVLYDATGVSSRLPRERHRELTAARRRLMRGNVPPLAYARYAAHQRIRAAKALLFEALKRWPLALKLRPVWLGWRRWSLRYR